MSDNAVLAILGIPGILFCVWMFFGDDILQHRRDMKKLEIDKIREERRLLEAQQNNNATDLRKPQ